MGKNERIRLDGPHGTPACAEPPANHDSPLLPDDLPHWESDWIDLGGEG
jgi:hypothetical protein